jgi:phospholipase D1/2
MTELQPQPPPAADELPTSASPDKPTIDPDSSVTNPTQPSNPTLATTDVKDHWVEKGPQREALTLDTNTSGQDVQPNASGPSSEHPRIDITEPPEHQDSNEVATPSGRRNVQFASSDELAAAAPGGSELLGESLDTPTKSRGSSIMSKLKTLTTTSGSRTPKSSLSPLPPSEPGTPGILASPIAQFFGRGGNEEQSDADADAEETADEGNEGEASGSKKKKRKTKRFKKVNDVLPVGVNPLASEADASGSFGRAVRRRASMPDTSGHVRGLSDGGSVQGRERPYRRGSSWMSMSMRPPGEEGDDAEGTAVTPRRAGHLRRISVFGGGGVSDGDAMTPRRPFFNSERASTFGAHRWKQVKNTLKLLRQKKEDRFDYLKSAELMAELRAGAPAVLMLASMIQRDEHGNKRIPVLLEQLKLRIKDSWPLPDDDKERHWIFSIELEYGSGPSRMNWTVIRTIRDIYNLHFRYRFALKNEKYMPGRLDLGVRVKQPKFPYSAFPYMRRARKKGDESDEDDQASVRADDTGEGTAPEGTAGEGATDGILSDTDGPRQHKRKKSRSGMLGRRSQSTGAIDLGELSNTEGLVPPGTPGFDVMTKRQRYVEKQRRILEKYLTEMIRWLMFRADSNRLCRFLELSALGVRLAAEGSYHGKEGYLHIQSSKGLDFRRVLTPTKVIARHSRKWFLVRQSYIVCVESPENMNIYDVYLVDPKFSIVTKRNMLKQMGSKDKKAEVDLTVEASPEKEKHHTLTLDTSERKVRLFSRNQSVMRQFEDSITEMLKQTPWHRENRFGSFAPVRTGVFAQWLVDGRDYMWNVSRAINMARDVIYIHDWWLSPELYMRRPACISQKWRLDRLLQKKAREGVKIFVIIYRNVEAAIPIDSEYTKFSLLNLHPNIFVQRSPNQFKKNQFFFAHHEKICVVDHDVAFVGGIDLCFGRWDCPQHPVADDKPTGFEPSERPKDAEHCQLFPGKDYSNPRVQDFFRLNEPYEEMYDRGRVPRMPWHDVSMQVVGQPARDLTRHFVQRWNYLRRGRKPTRPLPFLLPPPDARPEELEALGLTGTCEVQILRSASTWSLGTEGTECSIQTAYVQMIEDSDHFVYIENQFFITSTEVYGTRISNRIGDALVDRIIRAHENGEDWRCVVVMPLMPGFQNTVDEQEGTSVRLILMCQYRSICRGEHSIFGRLRAANIEPEDYISFFSLRQWGIMSNNVLVTEQLYIHAKVIIVDDRVALIGSANINERSMVGTRDSECAAVVRDTDMIWSTMAGKPYRVSRFAYTLRLRLMREHLGLDVDELLEKERQEEMERETFEQEMDNIYEERTNAGPSSDHDPSHLKTTPHHPELTRPASFNHGLGVEEAQALDSSSASSSDQAEVVTSDPRVTGNKAHELDVSGYGPDNWKSAEASGLDEGRDSVIVNGREVLVHDIDTEGKGTITSPRNLAFGSPVSSRRPHEMLDAVSEGLPPMPALNRRTTDQLGLPRAAQLPSLPIVDDTDIGGPPVHLDASGRPKSGAFHPMAADINPAHIDADCMRDPLDSDFYENVWSRVAANNTKLYRRVFRCMPDSEVSTWTEYREYVDYAERFRASMEGKSQSEERESKSESGQHHQPPTAAGAGVGAPGPEILAKMGENQAAKIGEKLAEKIPHPHHHEENEKKPDVGGLGGNISEFNEKQPAPQGEEASSTPQQSALDTSTPAANARYSNVPSVDGQSDTLFPPLEATHTKFVESQVNRSRDRKGTNLEKASSKDGLAPPGGQIGQTGSVRRRRRATTKGSRRGFTIDDMPSKSDAEGLLKMVQGNLVEFPYHWLLTEELNGNWGYQVDGVAPLAI